MAVHRAGLLNGYRQVEAWDFAIAIPGHGAAGTMQDVIDHRQYLEEIQASVPVDDYEEWLNYPDWVPLNVQGMYRMLTGL